MDNETKALFTTLVLVIVLVAIIVFLYTLKARKNSSKRHENG